MKKNNHTWLVTKHVEISQLTCAFTINSTDIDIPCYRRVRRVRAINGHLVCDCYYTHRNGTTCHHVFHIKNTLKKMDASLRWLKSNIYHFGKSLNYTNIVTNIKKLPKVAGVPYTADEILDIEYRNCTFAYKYYFKWLDEHDGTIIRSQTLPVPPIFTCKWIMFRRQSQKQQYPNKKICQKLHYKISKP